MRRWLPRAAAALATVIAVAGGATPPAHANPERCFIITMQINCIPVPPPTHAPPPSCYGPNPSPFCALHQEHP